jgi:NAD(P)-dependent dehydrogenase (short-subunit alcohol dehydrogenase family)
VKPLANRVALVTGGASGIGAATARHLAARGAEVAIADLVFHDKTSFLNVKADNRSVAEVRAAVAEVEKRLGRIDILVNNAGISGHSLPIEKIDERGFDDMLDIHVKGAFFYTQAAVAGMKARRWGRIISTSSHFALIGTSSASHYAGAKAALHGLTRAWALEFAPYGITVNLVAPALTETPLTLRSVGKEELGRRAASYPLGRLPQVEEPGYAVAWLASDEAAMVTAQTISPSGGIAIVGY